MYCRCKVKPSGANSSPADYANLEAISIADDAYPNSEWGIAFTTPHTRRSNGNSLDLYLPNQDATATREPVQ